MVSFIGIFGFFGHLFFGTCLSLKMDFLKIEFAYCTGVRKLTLPLAKFTLSGSCKSFRSSTPFCTI